MTRQRPSPPAISSQQVPIRTVQWQVTLTDSILPVRIDYLADIHTETGLALSLTELWHIGDHALKIISADFAFSALDEYHYFFKQKTESGFFRSKRKTVESERRSAEARHESRSSVGVYRFDGKTITADIADNAWLEHVPTVAELDGGAPASSAAAASRAAAGHPSAPPVCLFESVQDTPWCKLSIIFAGIQGAYRPVFARLTGEEVDEHYFEFFRRSSSRVIHRIDDVNRSGWRSRSYYIDPNAPAAAPASMEN